MGKLTVVVGGQFGSEGKGAVAAYLSKSDASLVAVRVAGPNAGHTVVGDNGYTYKLRQLPVAAAVNRTAELLIAAGSEVDHEVLNNEIKELDNDGYDVSSRLTIDAQATLLQSYHRDREQELVARIGSTGKGIGAARSDRVMRTAHTWGALPYGQSNTARDLAQHLVRGGNVLVEGTQGFGLGLHAGYYPHCTSSDCRAVDFLAMTGLSPWLTDTQLEVWVVARTYPIRVAGNSGPLQEISWEDLGVIPERTTVTNKIRRVGQWDSKLVNAALEANGAPSPDVKLALMMWDYLHPENAGSTNPYELTQSGKRDLSALQEALRYPIHMLGTSPNTVMENPFEAL